jgi:hypothetical protein
VTKPTQAVNPNSDLQLKYTSLLEQRIVQLEAAISDAAKTTEEKKDESATGMQSNTAVADKAKSRYRNVVRTYDRKTGVRKDTILEDVVAKKEEEDIAFTFRSFMLPNDPGEKSSRSEIDVEGSGLKRLLKKCIGKDYPGVNVESDRISMSNPFEPIVSIQPIHSNYWMGIFDSLHLTLNRFTTGTSLWRKCL